MNLVAKVPTCLLDRGGQNCFKPAILEMDLDTWPWIRVSCDGSRAELEVYSTLLLGRRLLARLYINGTLLVSSVYVHV